MTSLLALPPPSVTTGAAAPSGMARLRQMAASEAIPVTPIRPIPGQEQRLFRDGVEATEDAIRRHSGAERGDERGRAEETRGGGTAFRAGESLPPSSPVSPTPQPRGMGPTTAFLTQTIAQEAMGTGLHIEPWRKALGAYHRAGTGSHGPLVSNLAV